MIKILNSSMQRQAILKDVINPNKYEEINGEKMVKFSAVLDEKTGTYIDGNSIIELDDDYYDIAMYKKSQNQDGTLTIDVEAEHISYRMNDPDYDMEYFASTGSPSAVLASILSGTGFSVGAIEFSSNVTYSIQEKKSRRMMLMEFVSLLGGEVDFEKFTVSILQHRGSGEPKLLAKGKNIKVVSKVYNKRERDENGNPLISYTCEPIMTQDTALGLGDEVILVQKDLGIQEQLRIVRIGYNPYNPIEAEIELANFISGLEDQMYQIETKTVVKDKLYYGARIGPENGFESVRSDKRARAYFNADNFVMQSGDGTGNSWTNKLYFDPATGEYIFDGRIIVKNLDTLLAEIYKDSEGGKIAIYDKNGELNLAMGVEAGTAENVGGTLGLFNDGSDNMRLILAISEDQDAGMINLLDSGGNIRASIKADDANVGPTFFILDEDRSVVSYISATKGYINREKIATEAWVTEMIDEAMADHITEYHSGT